MTNYEIKNINDFTENARRVVFAGFGKSLEDSEDDFTNMVEKLTDEEQTEMDEILSQQESMLIVESMVRKQVNKKTKRIRYIVNEKTFKEIIEALNARLVSNILSNLTQKGLIESAYDDKLNDFVFWVQEDDKEKNKEKPETD
jgi:regulator of PEP synthase PpsR (kinase-PPPase family)